MGEIVILCDLKIVRHHSNRLIAAVLQWAWAATMLHVATRYYIYIFLSIAFMMMCLVVFLANLFAKRLSWRAFIRLTEEQRTKN